MFYFAASQPYQQIATAEGHAAAVASQYGFTPVRTPSAGSR